MKQLIFLVALFFIACTEKETEPSPLDIVLQNEHPAIANVMNKPAVYDVQIIYTKIDTDSKGKTVFTDYSFQLDAKNYFYPANSVALPAAALALEFIDKTEGISANDTYTISRDTLTHLIANDVQQIFAASNKESYNRLYELLGRDAINQSLRSKGLSPVRIAHRLETDNADNPQREKLVFGGATLGGEKDTPVEAISVNAFNKGLGFIKNDSLVSEPMDFSEKNYLPLKVQHDILKRIYFEENFSETERFQLSQSSKELLKKAMHTAPRKVGYDEGEFYDSYAKFFIFGNSRGRIQDHIKVYNKSGYGLGYMTDTALIVDEKKDVAFLISATILVNKNEIFNDELYEYGTIGLDFFTELGRGLYHYELNRKAPKN